MNQSEDEGIGLEISAFAENEEEDGTLGVFGFYSEKKRKEWEKNPNAEIEEIFPLFIEISALT